MGEIGQPLEVAGMDARGIEGLPVMDDVVIGVPQRPFQALELQRLDLVAARNLDGVEAGAVAILPSKLREVRSV